MRHKQGRQMTLRKIPDRLFQELQAEAKRQKTSINSVLLRRLNPEAEKKAEGACAPLLTLAGTWDPQRAKDFDRFLEEHRSIDREIWS